MILSPRRLGLAVLLAMVGGPGVAQGARPRSHGRDEVLHDDRGDVRPRERAVSWRAAAPRGAAPALAALRAEVGPAWIAWDDTTSLPQRIVLGGVDAPGVVDSSRAAASFATDLLARHLGLLAPGAAPSDFVLVANDLSAGIRSVGFAQHSDGVPVVGGQISFRFKHDRLIVIANDALPHVAVATRSLAAATAESEAGAWIRRDIVGAKQTVGTAGPTQVLPLMRGGKLEYREVRRVQVDVDSPRSRWSVFVDTTSGKPVARRQDLHFATAGVVYRVPMRSPQDARANYGAPLVDVTVDGIDLVTDNGGAFEYQTTPGQTINAPTGPLVAVENALGEQAALSFFASPGSGTVWDAVGDEFVDAQLTAFIHTSRVKAYVRAIDPALAWLDSQIPVVVNIDDQCNAFSDGNSINFYRASDSCENTGLLADVIYHEFGHSVHHQSVIEGVGFFDTALSEGTSDYLSMTIVEDSGVARGFFYDQTPLRDLDPQGFEYRWPDDRGEVHDEGRIIAGALWDLRKLMVAKYGAAGVYATDRIWYESTRRAVDIPSMYTEALVVDDDDGNLANGTPNICEINAAYGPHGLFSAGDGAEAVFTTVAPEGIVVDLQLALPSQPQCPVGAAPTLTWRLRGGGAETVLDMAPGAGGWSTVIPPQPEGSVVQYQVHVNYDNGTVRSLPDNFVDPWYEAFVGEVVPLYCTGFADAAAGWTLLGDWDVAQPAGTSGNRDPLASWDADGVVLGNTVSLDGLYQPGTDAVATTPVVSTLGYTNVRLQYRRWLTVEDGFFDQAQISADDQPLWAAHASAEDYLATLHHVDREWRFHDVDLSAQAADGAVQVDFVLSSDGGLEFGGWNIDALCVVAFAPGGASCGNGVLEGTEVCDDGNLAGGDGCDPACNVEPGMPGGEDDGVPGDSDDGSGSSGDGDGGLSDDGGLIGRGCGCDVDRRGGPLWLDLALPLGLALGWRRRRRS